MATHTKTETWKTCDICGKKYDHTFKASVIINFAGLSGEPQCIDFRPLWKPYYASTSDDICPMCLLGAAKRLAEYLERDYG